MRVGPIPNTGSDSEDDGTSSSSARQAYIPIPPRAFEPHVKDQDDEDEKDFVQPNMIGSGPNIRRPKVVVPRQPPVVPPRKPAPPQIVKEFLPIDVVLKTIFEQYYTDGRWPGQASFRLLQHHPLYLLTLILVSVSFTTLL